MRIAVVARHVHRGASQPAQALGVVRGLAARGHELELFTVVRTCERELLPNVTVHDVPVATVSSGRIGLAREISSFARNAATAVERGRFDVVYTRMPGTWVADVLYLPGLVDGEIARWVAGRGPAGAGRRLKDRLQPLVRPASGVRRRLERKALGPPAPAYVHVEAPAVRGEVLAGFELEPDRVVWIPPGIDLDAFRPGERAAGGETTILFCGHAFRRKGLDRAILALARMRAPARLVVVGGDDPAPYASLAREAGVADRVSFAGGVAEPASYFRSADLVVFPTRVDVWGYPVVEAMAAGIPPVVSTAAGAAGAVEDGRTGLLVAEPLDVGALAAALDSLALDPGRRARMGAAARAAVRDYAWPTCVLRIEELLLKASERSAGPSRRTR